MEDNASVLYTCPYDESHRIEKYRMARHLTKCEESHPNIKLEECPYNTLHRIKPLEFQHHLSICEDRINFVNILYEPEFVRPVETITVEEVNSINIPLTENWDTEPQVTATYNPLEHIHAKNLLYTPMLLSKSKKKKVKQQERDRHNAFTSDIKTCPPKKQPPKLKDELEKPLRLPRNIPQALIQNNKKNNNDTTTINDKEKTVKENTSQDFSKKGLKEAWKSKYMDEDLITFTKIKNVETDKNSINKDNIVEVQSDNTAAEKSKNATSEFVKDLQKNTDRRCSAGRGISRIYEMYKRSGASKEDFKSYFMNPKNDIGPIMKQNAEAHDYAGTFFGYAEEEDCLNIDIEDELSIIGGCEAD